jgi:hypothetical protein
MDSAAVKLRVINFLSGIQNAEEESVDDTSPSYLGLANLEVLKQIGGHLLV